MNGDLNPAQLAIWNARRALQAGNRLEARRWAKKAAELAPDQEEPWLIMAAIGSPRGSIAYLQRALEINPSSERARKGMHWAIQRMRTDDPTSNPAFIKRTLVVRPQTSKALVLSKPAMLPWLVIILLLSLFVTAWSALPDINKVIENIPVIALVLDGSSSIKSAPSLVAPPAQSTSPQPTFTPLPTLTWTLTPTSAPTETPTETPTPTETATPTATYTSVPSATNTNPGVRPENIGVDERWIDVDLSKQRTYAYQGDQMLRSFLVSTGTWRHPTVVGQFHIYVKYRYANMSGPGYYLTNVPYVMYFFSGYGLHGTYWHNNFGTPMSHGCINLRTEDAGWLFNWASIGTIVNVHP